MPEGPEIFAATVSPGFMARWMRVADGSGRAGAHELTLQRGHEQVRSLQEFVAMSRTIIRWRLLAALALGTSIASTGCASGVPAAGARDVSFTSAKAKKDPDEQ